MDKVTADRIAEANGADVDHPRHALHRDAIDLREGADVLNYLAAEARKGDPTGTPPLPPNEANAADAEAKAKVLVEVADFFENILEAPKQTA